MKEYEHIQFMAQKLGFQSFTELQHKAFCADETYNPDRWLFVIGATSSGKTLIPLLLYFREYMRKKGEGKPHRLLFAVPYRALAGQKQKEISEMAERLGLELRVTLSTGEFRGDDMDVLNGKTDIAVIIYEKVFMFSSMKRSFLDSYDMLVLDEIGLTQDTSRGIKADFILLQAVAHEKLRAIALGTPFYDWSRYISAGNFFQIQVNQRPILLETYPIYYTKAGVNYVGSGCMAVQPCLFESLHNRGIEVNPRRRTDRIIADICQYHLGMGHKILIFENNRTEVRLLAQRLCSELSERGVLKAEKSESACRQYILEETAVQNDEELYGIMDKNDYRAFSAGIGYHNADVPTSLRLLIEKEFLESDGCLRILCSTETLVYGINSNADAVIIPSMIKQHIEELQSADFLYPNEYMNYIGRAGRLDPSLPADRQVRKGYVYPFLKAKYCIPDEERVNPEKDQKLLWENLQKEVQRPLVISSCFFSADLDTLPFYLLSLFPNAADGCSGCSALTADELLRYTRLLPKPPGLEIDEKERIDGLLDLLLKRKLICIANDEEDEDEEYVPEYRLTDVGRKLSGYIIGIDDYDGLTAMICRCITDKNMFKADLLLGVMVSSEVRIHIAQDIPPLTDYYPQTLEQSVRAMKQMLERQSRGVFSKSQYQAIKEDIKNYTAWLKNGQYKRLAGYRRFQRQRLLFALFLWSDENCTIKQFYDAFFVNYTQMKRFAEYISYRLDIIRLALPSVTDENGELLYRKIGMERLREAELWMKEQSDELFYRIPAFICRFLNIQCSDPREAQKIRAVAKVYIDLRRIQDKGETLDQSERKKVKEIKARIETWHNEEWKKAFRSEFREVLL